MSKDIDPEIRDLANKNFDKLLWKTAPLMDKSKLADSIEIELSEVLQLPRKGVVVQELTKKLIALTDSYYLGLIPEKKHHIESDRNIAYREGWNDCRSELRNRIGGQQ